MNNKKTLLYAGGALVLGAVTYFVWAFFQKPVIPLGNTTIALGETEEEEPIVNSDKKFDFNPIEFQPIKTPDFYSDLNKIPLVKN